MIIDPTSAIGKTRLRVGDFNDLPIFPDSVYQSALDDCQGNLPRTSKLMAQYILATLTMRVHEKLANIEVYGAEYTKNYISFLKATILNPNMMELAPIPYGSGVDVVNALTEFRVDWMKNYTNGTASEAMKITATGGPLGYGY